VKLAGFLGGIGPALWQTHHPVRDLIASFSSSWVLNWHHLKVANDHVVEVQVSFNMVEGSEALIDSKCLDLARGREPNFPALI
jgi:hypothetical protein